MADLRSTTLKNPHGDSTNVQVVIRQTLTEAQVQSQVRHCET